MSARIAEYPSATAEADGYALSRSSDEMRRLVKQSQVWEGCTRRALATVGLAAGQHALDAGCGPGEVMRLMAERVGPEGRVTGLDIDGRIGREAIARLAATGGPAVHHFIEADLTTLGDVPGAPFDLVFARLIVIHMAAPLQLMQRLWSWVKPGGRLLLMDYDTSGARGVPGNEAVDRGMRMINEAFGRVGRNVQTGVCIPSMLMAAGIGRADGCEISSLVTPMAPACEMVGSVLSSLRPVILQTRLAPEEDFDGLLADLAAQRHAAGTFRWPDMVATWKRKAA